MKCSNCGATISDSASFCTRCGAKIEKVGKKVEQSVCPNCGETLRKGASFCVKCGTPIQKQNEESSQNSDVQTNNSEASNTEGFLFLGFIGLIFVIAYWFLHSICGFSVQASIFILAIGGGVGFYYLIKS